MPKYQILISRSAEKNLASIPKKEREKVVRTIQSLATNPLPQGCKKLSGEEDTFRVRVGDYRIIYEIQRMKLIILVLKIGHRKDIYR